MLSGVEVHQAKYTGDAASGSLGTQKVPVPWTPHEVDITYEPTGGESYARRGRKFHAAPFTQCISHANLLQPRGVYNPPTGVVPAGFVLCDKDAALPGGLANDVGREYLLTALRYTGLDNPLERVMRRKAIGVLARRLTYVGEGKVTGTPGRILPLPFAPHEVDIAWGAQRPYSSLHARRYPLMGGTEIEAAGYPYTTTTSYAKDPIGNGQWCHIGRDPNLGYGQDNGIELGAALDVAGVEYHVTLLRYLAFDPPLLRVVSGINRVQVKRLEYIGDGTGGGIQHNFGFRPHTVDVVWEASGTAKFYQARRLWPAAFTTLASSERPTPVWGNKEDAIGDWQVHIEDSYVGCYNDLNRQGVKYTATAIRYAS